MIEVYWSCLIGGIVFAIISFIAGDVFHHGLDNLHGGFGDHLDFLNPTTLVSAIAAFGGAGILLNEYTTLAPGSSIVLASCISIALSIALHFVYVRPMRRGENSVAFSMRDFPGQVGQVTVSIPAAGYGEVMIRIGAGNTNQIAASFDGSPIRNGARVVVIEVRDDTLLVSPFDDDTDEVAPPPRIPRAHVDTA
jgi:membrane protein implicated in regulation of membrane protease activity